MKKLAIFDLDGTLAESKRPLDAEMAARLARLLGIVQVAVISGGAWAQMQEQVLSYLPQDGTLKNLSILPTCGTKFYRYDGAWRSLYSEDFGRADKELIIGALNKALALSGFKTERHWGALIEDRGSQITFSALGQDAPLAEKQKWDPDFAKRKKIKEMLTPLIPGFLIQLGGATSIDITMPGIDKGYGIKKLHEILGIAIRDMIFVGDALFPGGNDFPAKQAGAESIAVRNPDETKLVIDVLMACLESGDAE
jgi:phosphomannomutase